MAPPHPAIHLNFNHRRSCRTIYICDTRRDFKQLTAGLAMPVVTCSVRCSAGKGFGDPSAQARKTSGKGGKLRKDQGAVKSGDSKAVQRAVKLVEEQEARQQQQGQRGGPAARPVDPREAARGKVEYVRVKDWGSGQPEDLGALQVDSDATRAFTAGGGEGEGAMPFHEALARRLELLQSQGALGMAQLPGGKPLPPFELWAFAEEHYVQYLADMYAVHAALESSIAQAAGLQQAAAAAVQSGSPDRQLLLQALSLFGAGQGLDRSNTLQQDLQRIAARGSQQAQQQQEQQASSAAGSSLGYEPPTPTQHAAAYAAYIASLARLCGAAEGPEEEEQAVLRLLAHAYIVQLMHLTSGGRVAAAAVEKLGLGPIDALAFHGSYPSLPSDVKPLERFVANTNALGQLLSEDQQEAVMQELAKAMTKSSMLLVPLARES